MSPQNVLVGVDGVARIADFGVAKWSEATAVTQAGVKGKFAYMAPEYIRTRKADRRADVFALGVLTWEALSGRRLFRGEGELESMQLVLEHTPEQLSAVRPSLPRELDAPIARALSKDPAERYSSVGEFARDLEASARAAGIDPSGEAVTRVVHDLYGDVLAARRLLLRDMLRASGEPSSDARALVGAPSEDQVTASAWGPVTISDARTVPRAAAAVVLAPPSDPPRPRSTARLGWALAGLAATSALVVMTMTMWSSEEPSRPAVAAPLALTPSSAVSAAAASVSAMTEDAALGSAVSVTHPPDPAPPRRPPTRPAAVPSAERAKKPGRPELGY